MRARWLSVLLSLLAVAPPARAAGGTHVAMLVWEGAGAPYVRRLIAGGDMPHLAALAARGATVGFARPPYARGRAATTAALWTGAGPDVNGVTGNFVPALPLAEHAIVDGHPALTADQLTAETLCVTAARAGKHVVTLDWPWARAGDRLTSSATPYQDPDATYVGGGYGRTLAEGGDGSAETKLTDALIEGIARQRKGITAGMHAPWDLFAAELSLASRAQAHWQGYVTPGTATYDAALAPQLRPHLRALAHAVDDTIGAMQAALPPRSALVVASDHGLVASRWDFLPNVVLRRAGLLTLDAHGQVDLSRTRVMYSATDGGFLVLNTRNRQGGLVPLADAARVLGEARHVLADVSVKTPAGIVPVTALLEPGQNDGLGLGGDRGGPLYLATQPGYGLASAADGDTAFFAHPPNDSAGEPGDPRQDDAAGIFFAAGEGVAAHAHATYASTMDVAPTVLKLLGVKPAHGRPLNALLR